MNSDPRFPILQHGCYLNHAALAPLPKPVADAIAATARESSETGSDPYPGWLQREAETRELLARLLHAPGADDIALLGNTSAGLSIVARGLQFTRGDNVVIPQGEFPSNRLPWLALYERGVEIREVAIRHSSDPEQSLLDAVDRRTRAVSLSAVSYSDGFRLNLNRIGRELKTTQAIFCVDAIQQLGALPLDVQAAHIDCLAAGSHKWLLGPEGIGVFYTTPAMRERLQLSQYGWRMLDHPFNFSKARRNAAASGRRFEAGSANNLGIAGLHAACSLLLQEGMENVSRSILSNTALLLQQLNAPDGISVLSHSAPERRSGIVLFQIPGQSGKQLVEHLQQQGIYSAARGDGIRFSPHFYTPGTGLKTALDLLRTSF